jgi:hypothetical protein
MQQQQQQQHQCAQLEIFFAHVCVCVCACACACVRACACVCGGGGRGVGTGGYLHSWMVTSDCDICGTYGNDSNELAAALSIKHSINVTLIECLICYID